MDQAVLRIELARGSAADQYSLRIEFRGPNAQASEILTKPDASVSLSVDRLLRASDAVEYRPALFRTRSLGKSLAQSRCPTLAGLPN